MSYVKKGIEKQDIMHALGVTCLVLLHLIAMHLSYVQCSPFNSFFSLQNRRNTIIELYNCWLILLVTYSLIFTIIPQYLVSIPLFPSGFQEPIVRSAGPAARQVPFWFQGSMYSTKCYAGEAPPLGPMQSIPLLYTIFDKKFTAFGIPPIDKWYLFNIPI